MTDARDELLGVIAVKSGYLDGIVAIAFCEAAGHKRGPGENACLPCINHAVIAMKSTRKTRAQWTLAALVEQYGEPEIEELSNAYDGHRWDVAVRRLVFPWQDAYDRQAEAKNIGYTS